MKKIVVGLGNPGSRYEKTRHNIGWMVLDRLAERIGVVGRVKARDGAATARGRLGDDELILVKPTTYMNLSGQAVRKVLARERVPMRELLVVVDDMALPLGRLRMKARGSAGGHNGLRSIIGEMETDVFARLRIGIGSPSKGAVEHVLGDFASAEQQHLDLILDAAADAVELWVADGPEVVASRWNGWKPDLGGTGDEGTTPDSKSDSRSDSRGTTGATKATGTTGSAGSPGATSATGSAGSAAEVAERTEPDAEGIVRTKTGWRRLLPHALKRDGGDESR